MPWRTIGRESAVLMPARGQRSVVLSLGRARAPPVWPPLALARIAVAHALPHALLCTPGPRLPGALPPARAVQAWPLHADGPDHAAHQRGPIGRRGGGGLPDAGDVFAQRAPLVTLGRGPRRVTLAVPRLGRLLGSRHRAPLRCPWALPRARHAPMRRCHRRVWPRGPRGGRAGARQSPRPLSLQGRSLPAPWRQGRHRQGQALRHPRRQPTARRRPLQTGSSHCLAIVSAGIVGLETTAIDRRSALRPRGTASPATPPATADAPPVPSGCPATGAPGATVRTPRAVVAPPGRRGEGRLPAQRGGSPSLQADGPLRTRPADDPPAASTGRAARRSTVLWPLDVRAGSSRGGQETPQGAGAGRMPPRLLRARPPPWTRGQRQVFLGPRGADGPGAPACGALRTEARHTRPDGLVGRAAHGASALPVSSPGPVTRQRPARRGVPRPGLPPQAQVGPGCRPPQTRQSAEQAVVSAPGRIAWCPGGTQRADERAERHALIPLTMMASAP